MPRYASAAWRAYRPEAGPNTAKPSIRTALSSRSAAGALDCRILGLDPGSRRTGFGVIDWRSGDALHVAHGCIDVQGAGLALRLKRIYEAVIELVALHRPTEIAIERVFMHRNADSALKLGQARGVALCAAVSLGAEAHEYAPRAIKQAVTGFGGAEKQQVAQMVMLVLSLAKRPTADAADALAIALCHAQSRKMAALLGRHS
jgi:crossover junction endodeoxyribonuclease RuvC